jgi:hypothetical protein
MCQYSHKESPQPKKTRLFQLANNCRKIEFRFALFRFKAKITQVKRSEKFEAKRSEKREVKFYSEIVKHM